ncbi:MAG TPA: urease accessory protein UreD [Rhodobacteraceae bacterium]|nr:urease accessory protein UreD [Paracoccaceae bacterium]
MLDVGVSPKNMQRAKGRAEVGFGASGLTHLYQSGCGKALLPNNFRPTPEVVFINTSGGVTGGDKLHYSASVEGGARLDVTTQAAERIYRAAEGQAEIVNALRLGENCQMDWLPQETILFDGAALKRQLNVEMGESASLLALETLVLGRKAMGETLRKAAVSDQWRIRRGGRLIYADALRLNLPEMPTQSEATLGGNRALATLVYVAPDAEDRLQFARSILEYPEVEAAASAWNGILILRFLAADAAPLRKALISFLTQFRGCDLPRVWHM